MVKLRSSVLLIIAILLALGVEGQNCPSAGNYTSNTDVTANDANPCVVPGALTFTKNASLIVTSASTNESATLEIDGNFTVQGQGTITLNGDDNSDSLIVRGDLDLGTSNADIVIAAGVLYVEGDLTISGNALFGAAGIVIIKGNLTINGGNADVTVDGGFVVEGTADVGANDLTVNDGAVFFADSLNVDAGNEVIVNGGGTIYVEDGLGSVTVDNTNATGDTDCTDSCCGDFCSLDTLTSQAAGVLPVTLSTFTGSVEHSLVVLEWNTATEINFEKFEIYKINGRNKELIGEVASTGNSHGDSYNLVDPNPSLGLNIYQLKSIDYDGYTEWFPAISVLFQPDHVSFELFPNPAEVSRLSTDIYEEFRLRVYALDGSLVADRVIQNKDFTTLGHRQAGLYLFKMDINGHIVTRRMYLK